MNASNRTRSFSIAITGSGGSGAVTTGRILLEAAALAGLQGVMMRSAGPQIRGGESAAMVRFSPSAVDCMGDRFDLLLALDWRNAERFADEIPLTEQSLILADPAVGEVPLQLRGNGAQFQPVAFKQLAASLEGGRINMVALGAAGRVIGLSLASLQQALNRILGPKGERVVAGALAALEFGYAQPLQARFSPPSEEPQEERWNLSGNQACALGALRGGVRFVAAYPITPASEMLEWLAPRLEQLGGSLLQAEDELASVNMIIGASFGGVASLTATSGPGLSLMMEGLGLAVMSETPVTVVDVMRGGPSTGIPTKSEQSDLNIALYGMHGDAPHLVLAPLSIVDCVFTTQWAVQLAEHLQTVSLVLSDQSLGQSRAVVSPPAAVELGLSRRVEMQPADDYLRYQVSETGISPMTLPGTPDGMYTADGLEHNRQGTPSSMALDHREQLAKRAQKLAEFDFGEAWAEIRGSGPRCIITWGSSNGAVLDTVRLLEEQGEVLRVIALRLLMPLQRAALHQALKGVEQILVVEQNHFGQLYHYLRAEGALPDSAHSLAQPGPLPLRPGRILRALDEIGGSGG